MIENRGLADTGDLLLSHPPTSTKEATNKHERTFYSHVPKSFEEDGALYEFTCVLLDLCSARALTLDETNGII